jgi:aspartyl-tRNA(Asn)/glutamyl-tRNA(Gln) amidotransferase subunit B
MIDPKVRGKYRTTIGIECHVQLKTKTKLFSAVGNDAREAPPNSLVSHIDFGMPGALPVLNEEAIHLATRAAFALGAEPEHFSKFDRKHYFYPDLPKGYQISQYDEPIIAKGSLKIEVDGEEKTIGITRAHLEEDAGKSTHHAGQDYSLVDLNRAGTPLLEIVSEPDMHTSAEAKAYARELYLRMRYADVSDANLFYGNMRFDVNVSVSKTDKLGTRSETKNLNSFKAVEKAVDYEVNRQIERLEKGQKIVQETRGWDDSKQKTFSQRTKEDADDYRYMPEPDIPPIVIEQAYIDKIKKEMPVMPDEWRQRLNSFKVDKASIETLLDADAETTDVKYLPLVEANASIPDTSKKLVDFAINTAIPLQREGRDKVTDNKLRYQMIFQTFALFLTKELSSTNAKVLLAQLLESGTLPDDLLASAKEKGLTQVSDESEIAKIVEQVIKDNPQAAEDVKNGEMKAIGFLVGQVMKASKGKANPSLAQDLIKKQLGL